MTSAEQEASTEPECPLCRTERSEVSWQTGPGQEVCGNDDCPINTWDERVRGAVE